MTGRCEERTCRASRRAWRVVMAAALVAAAVHTAGGFARAQESREAEDEASRGVLRGMLTPAAERSIEAGLRYLREAQRADGSWPGGHPVASTATALLAFMVHGRLPAHGEDAERLRRGFGHLIDRAGANGGYMASGDKGMYEHALATLALAEAAGESDRPGVMATLRSAVGVIVAAQNEAGGWRYTPDNAQADLSVSAMQVLALVAASEAGVAVPESTMRRARGYVERCYHEQQRGYSYQPGRDPGFASTASGTAAIMFLVGADHEHARAGVKFISADQERARDEKHFFYGHYYAAQCMYRAGRETHERWYPFVRDLLIERQDEDGGWLSNPGGKAYGTAMALIVLGAERHYLPIYQR